MIDALILICSLQGNTCTSIVSPSFFQTQQQCEAVMEQAVNTLKKTKPENHYTFKCVDWGTAT